MKEYKLEWKIEPQDVRVLSLNTNLAFWVCTLFVSILSTILIRDTFFLSFSLFLQIIFSLLSFAFSGFLFYWYLAGIQKLKLKRHRGMQESMQITLTQPGIRTGDEENFILIPWERIRKVEESKKYLLVKTKKKEKLLIPKRCFATSKEAQEVALFIKNLIQK